MKLSNVSSSPHPIFDSNEIARFRRGDHHAIYSLLGAHPTRELWDGSEVEGVRFAVWAPSASKVAVIGDFNGWSGDAHVMVSPAVEGGLDSGIKTIFVPYAQVDQLYQYQLHDAYGAILPNRADPVAFSAEVAPKRASRVCAPLEYNWDDTAWMDTREVRHALDQPMSIYEVHLGSWSGRGWLNYRDLADELIPYVSALGFTHIELMPITEYPFDGSWGYQTLGLFAPTSRYGTPEDLCAFIDRCHRASIGVILDWVPGHFPIDDHGLARFDGTCLYEHEDPQRGMHPDWGTCLYQYGRLEVRDFLISSALFWLERFHFDGLRVDAVASMLYLDYSREEGQWIPNVLGGREHLEAVDFLKLLNEATHRLHPGTLVIAEESTSWPGVSAPTSDGGLGFGRKWNMGWMNDTLRYISEDPIHRKYHHELMTFGLVYQYSERFILPISHDEVVHGKGSLLRKMPGDEWQRYANLRLYLSFMWTHPGQKLLFMGVELAEWREWAPERGLDWATLSHEEVNGETWRDMLGQPASKLSALECAKTSHTSTHSARHLGIWLLLRRLNTLYRSLGALHERDMSSEGFTWILNEDRERSVISYLRSGKMGESSQPHAIVILNFTPVPRLFERVGVPAGYEERNTCWEVALNSDSGCYGGSGVGPERGVHLVSEPIAWQGQPQSIYFDVPPLGAVILNLVMMGDDA